MTGVSPKTCVAVVFAAGRGVARWHERNAQSPVPGDWPYGLDALAAADVELQAVELAPLGRAERWLRRPRRRRSDRAAADVALAWDESLAEPMVRRGTGRRSYCGVIWSTDEPDPDRLSAARADALREMDGLWVLSRPQVQAVRDWLGPRCPPVHFLPFGVDADYYAAAPYPSGPPHLVSIGGDRDRDPATLFAAVELLRREHPDLRVTVQTAADLTPPAGVQLHRFIPHDTVRRLYADAAVVAVATRPNLHGSGMTVSLEAMSVGRPVVACGTPGMDDYVADGETGFLVPTGEPAVMALRISQLLADRETAAAMGAEGRARVVDRFTTGVMCAALRAIVVDGADAS